jgi:aminoglycoside phosphotransferase (APT) family kinase protein
VLSVELLGNGKSNTSYKLRVDDGAAYVLRLYSQGSPAREARIMDMVRNLAPVPTQLDSGDTWSLTTFLEGETLERKPRHSGAAAEVLSKIASVLFDSPGWIEADGKITPFPFGGVRGFIGGMLSREDVLAWTGRDLAEAVHRSVEAQSDLLDDLESQRSLVHGDFNPTNILVKDGVVSGVLDWEYAHSGTPFMDVGNLLRHTNPAYHPLIEHGLRAGGMDLPEDWQRRARLVDLTSHLEFLTSARSDAFKRECVARIKQFLRNLPVE